MMQPVFGEAVSMRTLPLVLAVLAWLATAYFAFLDTWALTPGLVHEYRLYAKIGTLTELRSACQGFFESGL